MKMERRLGLQLNYISIELALGLLPLPGCDSQQCPHSCCTFSRLAPASGDERLESHLNGSSIPPPAPAVGRLLTVLLWYMHPMPQSRPLP